MYLAEFICSQVFNDYRLMDNSFPIVFSPTKVLKVLILGISILIFANVLGQLHFHFGFFERRLERVVDLVHFDSEGNLPTLFSAMLLFMASVFLFTITSFERKAGRAWKGWKGLGFVFLYLGLDESIQLHEIINSFLRSIIPAHGIFFHAWVIPFIGLLFVFVLVYIPFVKRLERPFSSLFLLSGGLYVSGGLGMEMLSGYWMESHGVDFVYSMMSTLEESLEMIGIAVFNYSLILYMAKGNIKVGIVPRI